MLFFVLVLTFLFFFLGTARLFFANIYILDDGLEAHKRFFHSI